MGGGGYGAITQVLTQILSGIGQAVSQYKYGSESADMANNIRDLLFLASGETKDIASELDFPTVDMSPEEMIFAFANPNANPSLAGASFSSMMGMGLPTAGILAEGSPQARVKNQLGAMGLTKKQYDKAVQSLATGDVTKLKGKNAGKIKNVLQKATSDYGSFEDFQAAQAQWEQQSALMERKYAGVIDDIQNGRISALDAISQIQQDFPVMTESNILDMEQRAIDEGRLQIDRDAFDAREAALQQANVMGYNPARVQGDIEQSRLDQIFGLEKTGGLERALTLLGGEVNLSNSALSGLGSSLSGPISQGTQVGGLYSQGAAQMGDLALRQALATNQLLGTAEFFNAQQGTQEQMANVALLLQALGLQTQGGIMGAQADYLDATKTAAAFDTFTSSFGGGGGGNSGGSPLGFT
jgi:hypothetical protein